jgi:hypothetical protein
MLFIETLPLLKKQREKKGWADFIPKNLDSVFFFFFIFLFPLFLFYFGFFFLYIFLDFVLKYDMSNMLDTWNLNLRNMLA